MTPPDPKAVGASPDDLFIRVWAFRDAPADLQSLSLHGGDEDWLALVPPCYKNSAPTWTDSGTAFGCCDTQELHLAGGWMVLIGAHA